LFIEQLPWGSAVLGPGESLFVLHEKARGPFSLAVREEDGPTVMHEWPLEGGRPRFAGTLDCRPPFVVGAAVGLDLTVPPGPYEVLANDDFVVCGTVRQANFAGGVVRLQLIPVRIGLLTLPSISTGGVVEKIHPTSAQTTAASSLSSGPWIAAP
jgi:hypothetical protein